MSRESDIKALKQLKTDLNDAEAFAELAKEEWDKANELKAQRDNAKFVFKPLPTNNEETTKANFKNSWQNFFTGYRKFKAVFLGLYTVAMLIFAVMLFMDVYKNTCKIFIQPQTWDDPIEFLLSAVTAALFTVIAAIIPWVHILSSENRGPFLSFFGIAFGVVALFFSGVCDKAKSLSVLFIIVGVALAAIIVCFVIQFIAFIISKLPPILSFKQKAALTTAKQLDIDNAEANKVNEPKERVEWEAWWAEEEKKLIEIGLEHIARGDVAMEKAKDALAAADENDIIGNTEKDGETIDYLIHFIESRRADNIKEALHEYDNMKQNQKMLEVEAIKAQIEIEKAKKENADRQYELEMNRRHQIEMEAQARRNADMQAQIAANTAAAAASAERMRKDAAAAAADAAATQARVAADVSALYRNEYYNS